MRIKLLVGVVFVLLLGFMFLQLFGPNTGVILGPQTTFITKPLASDGLPDYAAAQLERDSAGVTTENNGAVLFWQAVGPAEMTPYQFTLLCEKLGISEAKSPKYLVDVSGSALDARISEWLKTDKQNQK
jgi:hypothetical protein